MRKNVMMFSILILLAIGLLFSEGRAAQNKPIAFLQEQTYEFPSVVEGAEVVHDFVLQNKGSEPLEIKKLKSG